MKQVAVIGGGLSGLAASVYLARRRYTVHLIEQSSRLGGRTYSMHESVTGDVVDNGQHLILDCYEHTLRYLNLIHASHLVYTESDLNLQFIKPNKKISSIRIPAGRQSRVALMWGIARYSPLSLSDRRQLLYAGHWLYNASAERIENLRSLSVDDWLHTLEQTEDCKKYFWYPLAIAIMNELPNRASAYLFARAMKIAVFSKDGPARIITPKKGLSEVFVNPAVVMLKERGAEIHLNSRVVGFEVNENQITGAVLKNGNAVHADAFIITGMPVQIQSLLPSEYLKSVEGFEYTPIITCNIWFDREASIPKRIGLVDSAFHWIFSKNKDFAGAESNGYVSMVMSGAREFVRETSSEIFDMAHNELVACFPKLGNASVRHYTVMKEKRATVSLTPNSIHCRPTTKTPLNNLFLAGDWIDTQLPATIEGAVMSGFRAAEKVVKEVEHI